MSKVSVLDTHKRVLEPCHPAVARRLLREGKAAVFMRYPFTIILKREVSNPKTADFTISIDPGSKCAGLAITDSDSNIVALFELHHRGYAIKKCLTDRAGHRRSRRTRKRRYREPRWANRSRKSPRLKDGQWVYEKVPNTRKTKNTFNRVSRAQLMDPRYKWKRLNSKPQKEREKSRLHFANGKRIRPEQKYVEIEGEKYLVFSRDGKTYYKLSNQKCLIVPEGMKIHTYTAKGYKPKKRWKREFVGEDKRPRTENGHRIHNGWIAPSLMSRVFNIHTWVNRLCKIYPITQLAVEHVKFDMQLMENPEISGEEYQQGELWKYQIKEYLLEKYKRKCYYCGTKFSKEVGFTRDHVYPTGKGGSDTPSNQVAACKKCNQEKGNRLPHEIDGRLGEQVRKALKDAPKPLKDAAAVNTIRWKIVETLKATGLPVVCATTADTKYNRERAGLPKEHYYDAACVACVPKSPVTAVSVLAIHAVGYGHRGDLGDYQTKQKAPGFKRPYRRIEHCGGFQKLDTVEMTTKTGRSVGCINTFDKTPEGMPQKLRIKTDWTGGDGRKNGNIHQLRRIQKRDGYAYQIIKSERNEPLQLDNYVQAEFQLRSKL